MSRVLVVDAARRPLMPTTPARARILLKTGRAHGLRNEMRFWLEDEEVEVLCVRVHL